MATHAAPRKARQKTRLAGGLAVAGAVAASTIALAGLPATAASLPLGTYAASLPLSPFPTVFSSSDCPRSCGAPALVRGRRADALTGRAREQAALRARRWPSPRWRQPPCRASRGA